MNIKRSTFELLRFAFYNIIYAIAIFLLFHWFPKVAWKVIIITILFSYASFQHIFNILHIFDKEMEEGFNIDEDK